MSNPLRKAAVLISALDSRSADALLDQMSESQAAMVRTAIMDLDDIDPAEEQQVLREFMESRGGQSVPAASTQQPENALRNDDDVELEVSSQALAASQAEPLPSAEPQTEDSVATPFEFLHGTAGERLAGFLESEHPQTIAMVLSHLPPQRASEALLKLEASLQVEVLERIAEMDQTDPAIVREVEQQLHESLAGELDLDRRRKAGLSVVKSILAAAGSGSEEVLQNLSAAGAVLSGRLQANEEMQQQHFKAFTVEPVPATVAEPAVSFAAIPPQEELQPAEQALEEFEPAIEGIGEATFEDVMLLQEFDLAALLAVAEPEITLVALTGAPPEFVERIVSRLPRRQRRNFIREMEQTGPLRLRDIELAQMNLADLAFSMAVAGEIHIPHISRFIAAA